MTRGKEKKKSFENNSIEKQMPMSPFMKIYSYVYFSPH